MIAVLVAALLVAQTPTDTVFTVDGGRIAGTVLEDSPTAGVTLQTPDGAVRRIERSQVVRIEFADGTVSTPRAAPPPPAAPATPPAPPDLSVRPAVATAAGSDTVYLAPSGRVRGTVMEESATGVKVRRLDGSVQEYAINEVSRIEYADGSVSTPRAAPKPAPAAPAPAPAPRASPAEAPLDTVFFLGGGRVRGTVIEEHPRSGVKIRLLDGTVQTYARDDLVRIEYADGTVSRRKAPPAPAPAVAPHPAPPPAAVPAAPPPPQEKEQPAPLYVTLGVGGTLLGGSAEKGVLMASILEEGQVHFSTELGLRLSPAFAIGGYADAGAGDPSSAIRESCRAQGVDCIGVTGRYGLLLRHTWDPLSDRPKWLSVGTGWEFASVEVDRRDGSSNTDLFRYEGRELVRIGAGVDFRSNAVLGLGLYGSIAWGEYDKYKDPTTTASLSGVTHTTAQLGLRLTLFP